jgi:lysophospholipase L1-like esterase
MLVRALLLSLLLAVVPTASALAITVTGFGSSITCDDCNDGSYLRLLQNYLEPDPVIDDQGNSGNLTEDMVDRVFDWIDNGNTSDVVIILAGTPDTYTEPGGFGNQLYVEGNTVDNIEGMIDMILAATIPVLLVAPPSVDIINDNCGGSGGLTCATIDARLASLSIALGSLASTKSVPFVDLYGAY